MKLVPRSLPFRFYICAIRLLLMIAKNTKQGQYSLTECTVMCMSESLIADLEKNQEFK